MSRNHLSERACTDRTRTRIGMSAVLLACATAGTLLNQTAVASAASRGFKVKNDSKYDIRVVGASPVPAVLCGGFDVESFGCVPASYDIGFEGRPADGTVVRPGGEQTWELKYYYNVGDLFGTAYNYAAKVKYKIAGTDGNFEATIKTSNYSNDSTCEVTPKSLGSCTAAGLKITLK
jgi:hypothetical protein